MVNRELRTVIEHFCSSAVYCQTLYLNLQMQWEMYEYEVWIRVQHSCLSFSVSSRFKLVQSCSPYFLTLKPEFLLYMLVSFFYREKVVFQLNYAQARLLLYLREAYMACFIHHSPTSQVHLLIFLFRKHSWASALSWFSTNL